MINPVSSSSASSASEASQPALPKTQLQPSNSLPQDTVTLKSAGDVDHDGDSK